MAKLNEQLDSISSKVMGVDAKEKEKSQKRDKLLPRERINAILDPGTPFLEFS